jgi:hypothetical protein
MIESDQIENFAVCCTANLTIEVVNPLAAQSDPTLTGPRMLQAINHFFAKVQQQEHEEAATPVLTLVDNLKTRLWVLQGNFGVATRTGWCKARLLARISPASSSCYSRRRILHTPH